MLSFLSHKVLIRLLCPALLFLGFSFTSCKQKKYVWSTEEEYFKLDLWHDRVKSYKKVKFPPNTATIFIGDSMTEGYDINRMLGAPNLVNMGISGDFTSGVLMRLDHIKRLQPKMVFIMIGINDILKKVPIERTISNYGTILDYLQKNCPQTQVFVQSNLPTTNMGGSKESNEEVVGHVRELNAYLSMQCSQRGITFVNMYSFFEVNGGELNPAFTYDGLHLSEKGYEVWTAQIKDFVLNGNR